MQVGHLFDCGICYFFSFGGKPHDFLVALLLAILQGEI